MLLYKVSFAPILGMDDKGEPTKVGRYMCYVTAREVGRIQEILEKTIPEYAVGGFDVVECIDTAGKRAWSVSVGPESRSRSILIVAESTEGAGLALAGAVQDMPVMRDNVAIGLFRSTEIDLSTEGVW